ncbi:MAG: hypothetical protein M3A44_06770 [Gammaproteobacteria bacterium]
MFNLSRKDLEPGNVHSFSGDCIGRKKIDFKEGREMKWQLGKSAFSENWERFESANNYVGAWDAPYDSTIASEWNKRKIRLKSGQD